MNERIFRHTERMNRGITSENKRNKDAADKEHSRKDDATIIVPKPKWRDRWKNNK